MKYLSNRGAHQILLCRQPGRLAESASAIGVEVHCVGHWLRGHGRRYPVDVWHAHDGKGVYWAWLEHALRKTPYLLTRRVDRTVKSNGVSRAAYRNAAYVACLSRAVAARVEELDPATRRVIIPSSYSSFRSDPDAVARIRARFPGKFLVGQVGSLLHIKGQHLTLQAARTLAGRLPDVHFVLVGDGPERANLEEASKDLPNVSLLGQQNDIGPYFAAFDLFVFPSLSEGLGSSILEAMQAGTPVLASRTGGIPDLIQHETTGWLIETGNAAALTEAIEHLYRHPELRESLRQAASAQLEKFSPDTVAKSYYELYQSVLNSSASREERS